MNDAELAALAARAAARTRAEAEAIADSPAALQQLLADEAVNEPAGLAPVVPYHGRITDDDGSRRRRVLLAIAAVAVLLVGAIGYAILSGSGTIEVAGPPSAGTGTGVGTAPATPPSSTSTATAPPTAPADETATTPPSTAQASAPSTASSTEPAATPTSTPTSTPVPPAEPFDGWAAPALAQADLGDLPYLLPAAGTWSRDRALRSEFASEPGAAPEYVQVWVRTVRASLRVDAVVVVRTTFTQSLYGPGDAIDIAGWPSAVETATANGVVAIGLSSSRGAVDLRGYGLTREDVVAIASSLRTDVEAGAGWLAAPLAGSAWIPVEPGAWRAGFASRNVRVLDDAGLPAAEVGVSTLAIDAAGPGFLGTEIGLTDIGGAVAVTIDDERVGAVVWRRPDGTTVTVGQVGPVEATVELARSLAEVDRAMWDAATTPDPEFGDGCNGLFC